MRKAVRPNAKGARHYCQAPCRRTTAVDPDGSSAWFRRQLHSRRQGHASFASVVEAGRFQLPKELRLPASAARFLDRPGADVGSLAGCFPDRSSAGSPLARRSGTDRSTIGPILRSRPPLGQRRDRGLRPSGPVLPLRTAARAAFSASGEPCSGVPRSLRGACAARRLRNFRSIASPSLPRCGFPKAPASRPVRVSG